MVAELKSADRVIGFNIISFDYEVLKPYAPNENFRTFRSTDMLQDIYRTLNFRLSLDYDCQGDAWQRPRLPMEFSRLNGSGTANWIRLLNIASQMWISRAASMSLAGTMVLYITTQNWVVN